MGKLNLRRSQKQELGEVLTTEALSPTDFQLVASPESSENRDAIRITHTETGEVFDVILIRPADEDTDETPFFNVERELVESQAADTRSYVASWNQVLSYVREWAQLLEREVKAEDPWSQLEEDAYEDMQQDDELFNADELPRVDRAIDTALKQLTSEAAQKKGNDLEEVKRSVAQIEAVLKSAARSASKREWLTVFKTVITTEIAKWGLEHELLGKVTHTLISAAQDVAQLAEHASKLQL